MKPPIDAPYILCMCVRMINTTLRIWMHTRTCISKQHTHKHKNKIHTWSHVHNGSVSNGCLSRSCLRMHCVSRRPACMVVPLISSLALEKHSCLMLLVKASRASNPKCWPSAAWIAQDSAFSTLFSQGLLRLLYFCWAAPIGFVRRRIQNKVNSTRPASKQNLPCQFLLLSSL
jgi:hypothetical protein